MDEKLDQWLDELVKLSDEEKMTDKQLKIIKAAVETFSEKGYASSSTSEIAQKAGVAEGTIFRHYKTKKDLLVAIVTPLMTRIIAPFVLRDFNKVLHMEYDSCEEFLRAVIRNRLAFAQKHQKTIKILLQEIPFQPELKEQFQDIVANRLMTTMKNIVEHYQGKGQIIALPPLVIFRFTATTVIGHLFMRMFLLPDLEWDDDKEIEHTIQLIMHGISARPNHAERS
ncbi:TetR/AcrR family transcriptional regulator [Xylanibacillus composti]|uniref:TetR family transcriptional regulator n=1 Tax=Xylanibacillus composti TaxID=1572762 RepID=A0A8J4H2M2_9BACL|nr:TetR/AcrR family transcriptional regulator [Xylanibacillus composti]MDT9724193.1 TetR/AcrR family transcriptional regulator [Xylanibacillus composti]GIQ68292.1 TetR family transcriptional regulator [Xylanibacillus composti]